MIKVGPSPSKKNFYVCFNDSPSKMMDNVFYFILKDFFVLKIFNFQIYDITSSLTKNYNTHIAQYLTN